MFFETAPGFCSTCGTILPVIGDTGNITCYLCKTEYSPEALGTMEAFYEIHYNDRDVYLKSGKSRKGQDEKKSKKDEAEGPIVERKCPKCGYEKMSYATLQLRSADEGQTVFYTCIKCKFKESENS